MDFHKLWLAWVCYMSLGVVGFLVAEFWTIFNKAPGDTLSEVVWALHVPAVVWFLGAGLVLGLVAWLVPHFISQGKWGI